MGGVSGLIYSALPVAVLVPVNTAWGLVPAISAALGVAALILVWPDPPRLRTARDLRFHRRRDQCADRLAGRGVERLLPAGHLDVADLGGGLRGVRADPPPIVGYAWSWIQSHDRSWRSSRRAVIAFDIATVTWVLVFASRFVVQRHLYDLDQTGWLGWPASRWAGR